MTAALRMIFAYRIASRLYFHLPVLFVWFYQRHFSLPAVEVLLALYGLALVAMASVPSRLAARFGSRAVLAAGEVVKVAGLVLLATTSDFAAAAAAQVITGIGASLTVSLDSQLIRQYTSNADENGRAQSVSQSYMFLAVMVAGITGAVIFAHAPRAVFWASAGASVLALATVLALPGGDGDGQPAPAQAQAGGEGSREGEAIPAAIRAWGGYYLLLRGVTLAAFVGFLPYYFFTQLKVQLAYFGAVLSLFSLAAFAAARLAPALVARSRPVVVVAGTIAASAAALAVFAAWRALPAGLAAITLLGLASGGVRPLTMGALGRSGLPRAVTARFSGRLETVYGLVNAGILLAGGLVLRYAGLTPLLAGLAVITVAAGSGLLIGLRPRRATPAPATAPKLTAGRR